MNAEKNSENCSHPTPMRKIFTGLILLAYCSCSQDRNNTVKYPLHVGDIAFDKEVDDPNFKICTPNKVFQYFNFGKSLQYHGEKSEIIQSFGKLSETKENEEDTGFITIRFIVNCEGKTGWFRVQGMGMDYLEKKFSSDLVDSLLIITKELDGWVIGGDTTNKVDYYQYLTFKIENGRLVEIMP